MTGRAWFETLGCKANQYESRWLAGALADLGWELARGPAGADLVVVNTCAVTAEAERKSRQALGRARRQAPGARLVALGCLVAARRRRGLDLGGVDLALAEGARPEGRERLLEWLGAGVPAVPVLLPGLSDHTRALLKAQDGCDSHCTYCLIPALRGPSRSRPLEELIAEARSLWAAGVPEVVLTGVCLGSWRAGGRGLETLVRALAALEGPTRLRLSSVEPEAVGPALLEAMAEAGPERVCPHLHLPLQHGSARLLRRMGRPYGPEAFLELARLARRILVEPALTTDVIVGFPGEEQADHEATLGVLEALEPTRVHVFPYSPRAGTPACRLPDRVPPALVRERALRARSLSKDLARQAALRRLGAVEDVVMERAGAGLSGRYQRIRVAGAAPRERLAVRVAGTEGPVLIGRRLP